MPDGGPLLLLLFFLVTSTAGQYNPTKDFCRRFGHQAAVVDSRVYVDGGFVNWKPFSATSPNYTNPFLLYSDLNSVTDGMPTLSANLSKNATIPNVNGGILWEDAVNKRLYLYGGEVYQAMPTDFNLYSYDILSNDWVSFGPPTGARTIQPTSYGAGVSISWRGEAYYYGGWFNNASVPGWTGPPRASNRLIKYTMDTNTFSNLTGPDDIGRAEGTMVYIPIGDAGTLIYFGGSQDLYGNSTLTPQPLDKIFVFDVANTKWYTQTTSGRAPENRRRFCGGATWAQDQSSYNVYIYGGSGFPPDTTGYDDIYILTIPSFQWIRGPYPAHSNVTGAYPKNMMTCNVVNGGTQMLVIGGTYSNDTTYMCDADNVWGEHNMNLGEQNKETAIWGSFIPTLTTYAVPTDILTAVGGAPTGGAKTTAPVSGFDAPDLYVLMTRKADISTRAPTRVVSATATANPNSNPGTSLSTGAIAGIAVGSTVGLIALLTACCCMIRYKQKHETRPRHSAIPTAEPPPTPIWTGPAAVLSSPTSTHASYRSHPPPIPPPPPAELPGNGEQYYDYHPHQTPSSASPSSFAKHDQPPSTWLRPPEGAAELQIPSPRRGSPRGGGMGGQGSPLPGAPYWSSSSPRGGTGPQPSMPPSSSHSSQYSGALSEQQQLDRERERELEREREWEEINRARAGSRSTYG
ncbi:hypothetical protein B0T19DRAFT_354427 [Cercophora scortea]|uniref:Kelch repeat-containing protein n=1 Tax=Cercophora scortea TaxID=314031 RepID=A0AAE0J036_9PEZI|nr:hypothetical protein B0T19DRAFT_354427 [Cercophora scortea]